MKWFDSTTLSELINNLCGTEIPSSPQKIVNLTIKIIELYEKQKLEDQKIKIKYTEDEYGDAARELGLPKYSYFGEDAGIDLPVVLDHENRQHGFTIFPGDRAILHSGLLVEPPQGYWSRIIHRSSTERRHRLRVIEGVIDWGYRAEVLTQVHNSNSFPITIQHGQRIAQLILCPLVYFKIEETNKLADSKRGHKGFGSSGV